MTKFLAALVALTAGAALLIASGGALANNDPHRVFQPLAPFDLPAMLCGFPVHVDSTVQREYGSFTALPDGSTLFEVTGSVFATLTNTNTGKAITVNTGGPGRVIYNPDFTSASVTNRGFTLNYATNLTDFGFPSNIIVVNGLYESTVDLTTTSVTGLVTVTSITRYPHLQLDVCAALAP